MKENTLDNKKTQNQENGLLNILVNIIIPVLILNKLGSKIGSLPALMLALSFPLFYGLYDIIKFKKFNFISLLGLLNISITGSLALLNLGGIWFSIKEAAFPALIGIAIFLSAFTRKSFIETLFLNPQMINLELVQEKLKMLNTQLLFQKHLKICTFLFSLSFVFSAIGNFMIAVRIFIPIDEALTAEARNLILNEQIAEMTAKGAAILILPSMIFSGLVLWYLIVGIKKFTQLHIDQILHHSAKN